MNRWASTGIRAVLFAAPLLIAACGSDDTTGSTSGGNSDDPQTPPQGAAALEAWLADGYYKDWKCETAEHDGRSPSPHAVNRICSNDVLSANPDGADYPAGAASVKELWDGIGGNVIGYAVILKLQADSAGGAGWYYFERNPTLDPQNPVADGVGTSGNAKDICVGCHQAAGADDMHSGHDFVYTQVQ